MKVFCCMYMYLLACMHGRRHREGGWGGMGAHHQFSLKNPYLGRALIKVTNFTESMSGECQEPNSRSFGSRKGSFYSAKLKSY